MLKLHHLLSQVVRLFDHHLRHLYVPLIFPVHEGSLLHPGVHVCKHNVPVRLGLLELVLVRTPGIENFAEVPRLMSLNELVNTLFIFDPSLSVQDTLFVEVEGLSEELFSGLFDYEIRFVLSIVLAVFAFSPAVHGLLEIPPVADFDSSDVGRPARSHNLIFFLFDLNIQGFNLSLHLGAFFFHAHDGHLLELDSFLSSSFLPHVESLLLSLMESTDYHGPEVFVDGNFLCLVQVFPVLEVAG